MSSSFVGREGPWTVPHSIQGYVSSTPRSPSSGQWRPSDTGPRELQPLEQPWEDSTLRNSLLDRRTPGPWVLKVDALIELVTQYVPKELPIYLEGARMAGLHYEG